MLPVVYVFRYDGEKREKALKRFQCSLENVYKQTTDIYILDSSNEIFPYKIWHNYPDIFVKCKQQTGVYNKSKLLNHLIKKYMKHYEYCILMDIDIIVEPYYFEKMEAYYTHGQPCRVTGFNQGAAHEFYTSDFNEGMKLIKENGVTSYRCGESVGIGLLHIPSFLSIRGFNEDFQEYGPEDCELNRRLSYVCKHIYDPSIVNIHLWHEPNAANFTNQNNEIYRQSEKRFLAGDLIRNYSDTWGEY